MELKVGMYIRTKDKNGIQYIRKVVDLSKDIRDGSIIVDKYIHNVKWVSKKNVLKSSYEKMDLIRPGDYVNGRLFHNELVWTTNYGWIGIGELEEKDITSIVTKEQFNSVKYEVNKDE